MIEFRAWLRLLTTPGTKIKRWILLAVFGIAATSYGVSSILRRLIFRPSVAKSDLMLTLTLQRFPYPYRDLGLISIGLFLVAFSSLALLRSLTAPFPVPRSSHEWVESLVRYQRLQRGPVITVIGCGDNLKMALHGLKLITNDLTVVLTPEAGATWSNIKAILHAARPYIVSLSEAGPVMEQILSQPVQGDEHTSDIGDILLSATVSATRDIEAGLRTSGQILALRGQVVPALRPGEMESVLRPSHEAVRAIMDTDLLIFAPNTLQELDELTGLFAEYAPLKRAVDLSRGLVVCIAPTEATRQTLGYLLTDYLKALNELLGEGHIRLALADSTSHSEHELQQSLQSSDVIDEVQSFRLLPTDPADQAAYDSIGLADAVLSFHRHSRPGFGRPAR